MGSGIILFHGLSDQVEHGGLLGMSKRVSFPDMITVRLSRN